jgi:hypothetical protein
MHYSTKITNHCAKDRPNVIIIDPDYGDGDPSRWPEQDQDMTLLARPHDKHVLWRRTAGDWLAKELNLYDGKSSHVCLTLSRYRSTRSFPHISYAEVEAAYWIIDDLPKNYGLFEQVTHPKEKKEVTTGKQRLDRFVFGEPTISACVMLPPWKTVDSSPESMSRSQRSQDPLGSLFGQTYCLVAHRWIRNVHL